MKEEESPMARSAVKAVCQAAGVDIKAVYPGPEVETRILLVRHGFTAWNGRGRYQGRMDTGLAGPGWDQSRALAGALCGTGLAAVYASPLARARQTAELVAEKHGLTVELLPGMVEICHGDWEGRLIWEVEEVYAELLQKWRLNPYQVHMPGGESLAGVEERAWSEVRRVTAANPGRTLVIVTHDIPVRVILKRILGLSEACFWRVRLDNAAINELCHRGGSGFHVVRLNDTCHLAGLVTHDQRAL